MAYEPYYLKDVLDASAQKKFTVISTFAGGGGSSTGYRLAGGDVLLINEFVEEAIETYKANFPDTKVLVDDIKKYKAQDFLDMAGIKKGELDILDGSPPCSAFSVAGKREKGWDKEKVYSDGKMQVAIEDLFYEFIRIAEGIQPKVIVAENVKGITFGKAIEKLNAFINEFEKIGYNVTYKVLNAADYGVPQGRERTIFICVRNDVCDDIGLSFLNINSIFPVPTHITHDAWDKLKSKKSKRQKQADDRPKHISLKEAIHDIENDPEEEKELLDYVQNGFQKKWIELLEFNPKKHIKPSDTRFIDINPKRSLFNMIRPCPDDPCPTITQRGNQKSVSGVFHYEKNRKFTIRELIRIMSLPEDFILTGNFDKKAERIGRMVAPKMMVNIANSIYENILKEYNND
jgi:DNA (cytosine-5)-methyltransferase 1